MSPTPRANVVTILLIATPIRPALHPINQQREQVIAGQKFSGRALVMQRVLVSANAMLWLLSANAEYVVGPCYGAQ